MNNQNAVIEKASAFLGKNLNNYQTNYNPNLLVPIERKFNREDYKITNSDFCGYDIWHNYECSFMTENGYPVSLVGKVKIPCDSKYFIESKSMKLYFFSFHMEKIPGNKKQAIEEYKRIVIRDLSARTESNVQFEVFEKSNNIDVYNDFKNIEDIINIETIKFDQFKETPDIINVEDNSGEIKVRFNNIRSNCRVTHQPDFANLFIYVKGNKLPSYESLLKYVVSFRNEYHFHEEVTEQIYKVLLTKLNPEKLLVQMLFTRRGGIDINPVRANDIALIDSNIIDINCLTNGTVFQ